MIFDGLGFRKEVWFSDKKIMNLFLIKITADGRKGQRGPLTPHPYIKLKIAIQVPKTYRYSLFRVLSTLRF